MNPLAILKDELAFLQSTCLTWNRVQIWQMSRLSLRNGLMRFENRLRNCRRKHNPRLHVRALDFR